MFTDPLGLYKYSYEWEIGDTKDGITAESAITYMQQHPNGIFLFEVAGKDGETIIQGGAIYDLNDSRTLGFPSFILDKGQVLMVSCISDTSFTTLPGHFDPLDQL